MHIYLYMCKAPRCLKGVASPTFLLRIEGGASHPLKGTPACLYLYIYIYVHACIYVHIFTHIYMNTFLYIYIEMYIHIYMYIYIYTYIYA